MAVMRFLSAQRDEVFDVLRLRLLKHVAHVLSRHGNDLNTDRPDTDDQLREAIAADLQRPAEWVHDHEEFDKDWSEVISHFCRLAAEVARAISSQYQMAEIGHGECGLWSLDDRFLFWIQSLRPNATEGDGRGS
nr:hypothetical protein [Pseudomonas sp. LPH1]